MLLCRASFFVFHECLFSEVMSCRREIRRVMHRLLQIKAKLVARAEELTEVGSVSSGSQNHSFVYISLIFAELLYWFMKGT